MLDSCSETPTCFSKPIHSPEDTLGMPTIATTAKLTSEVRPPLRVLILSDGRPGHFNQSKGVLRAIEFHYDIETEWCELKLRAAALRPFLTGWLNHTQRASKVSRLGMFYQSKNWPTSTPDLVVSAGGNTLHANVWMSRAMGCRNLFIGDIRQLRPHCFWRVLTFRKRSPSPPFIHWEITPAPILPEEIAQQGIQLRSERNLGSDPLWTMLIGGNGGGYTYRPEDWQNLIQFLEQAARRHGIRWLVITGRRTGVEAERMIASLLPARSLAAISLFSKEEGTMYRPFLGAGERIVTTEDSHMMLTEAISTCKPVLSVRPRDSRPDGTNQLFFDSYTESGCIQRASLEDLASGSFTWDSPTRSDFTPPLQELGGLLRDCLSREAA